MNNSTYQSLLNRITLVTLLHFSVGALADGFSLKEANTKKIKKEKWVCKYCPAISNTTARITINLNNNSGDEGRFSSAIGDNKKGIGGNVDVDVDKREQDKHYRFLAKDLGKENVSATLLASKTDSYKASIAYEALNYFGHTFALTPFINAGNSSLQLPDNWQRVATTSEMPSDSFIHFSKQLERESWRLSFDKQITQNWQGYIHFKSENKQGIKTTSGNILNKVVMLPNGVDQQHQQFNMGSYYTFENATLSVSYYKSDFNNKRSSIRWQSPYSVLFGGAESGQLSTEPDNQFNQVSIFGHYRHNNFELQARFNYGQLSQKESFLPYSINPLLITNTLPTNNLNGEIKTLSNHIKIRYKTENKWRISLDSNLDDRKNNTQSNDYQRVFTDSVVLNSVAMNRPYSFKKTQVKLQSKYRFIEGSQLAFGWKFDQRERDFQDRNKTKNNKYWFKISTKFASLNSLSFELSRALRDGTAYNRTDQNTLINDALNLQKYYQADREREQARGQVSFNPFKNINTEALINTEVSFQAYFSRDQYRQTDIGLIESKRRGIDLSLTTPFNKHVSLLIYTHNQWQDNLSQGSYWFNEVDWHSDQEDKSDSAGISLMAEKLLDGKLSVAIDYTYSYAIGNVLLNTSLLTSITNNNELIINSQDIKVYADYIYSPDIKIHFGVLYQYFDEQDWRFDYTIDRVANVLGNGISAYNIDDYRITGGIAYQF